MNVHGTLQTRDVPNHTPIPVPFQTHRPRSKQRTSRTYASRLRTAGIGQNRYPQKALLGGVGVDVGKTGRLCVTAKHSVAAIVSTKGPNSFVSVVSTFFQRRIHEFAVRVDETNGDDETNDDDDDDETDETAKENDDDAFAKQVDAYVATGVVGLERQVRPWGFPKSGRPLFADCPPVSTHARVPKDVNQLSFTIAALARRAERVARFVRNRDGRGLDKAAGVRRRVFERCYI
jgi:hypothetical protein